MSVSVENDDGDEIRRLINVQDHEFSANFNYDHGLDAWLACDSVVKQHDGSYETETEALGETWDVTLRFQPSGVLPPRNGVTPNGTTIEHETIREFRIECEAQDELGEKKANFHIRPRWRKMRVETNTGDRHELSIPTSLVEDNDAINVRASGSNIDFCDYCDLLMCAASAVDVSGHYFSESYLHETSNIQDAAKYVRLHADVSGPVHARTGPLVSLAHVLENDREGYRKLVQNDSNERGRQLAGYYHTATLGPSRVREVFPDHVLPVECKHYYAREAHARPDSHALSHPKVEVAYQTSRWDNTLHLTDENLAELDEELTEWLYAILADAGLDLRANENVYVEDQYFKVENETTTASVVDLDLTEVRHEQESVVYKHLADGMAPTDQECLDVLVSDGGTVSPQDLAESTGRHEDTVYNSLARMNDLVTHRYGEVNLKSTYTSELVADALDQAQQAVDNAAKTAADAVHASKRGLDNATSAFVAWCERYGVNYNDNGDGMTIDLGRVDSIQEVRNILRSGFDRWCNMKRDAITFKSAKVKWEHEDDGNDLNYLPSSGTVRSHSQRAFTLLK